MSQTPKHRDLTLAEIYDILNRVRAGEKQIDIAKDYDIDKSAVSHLKKKESDIREKVESGQQSLSTKKVMKFGFSEIEADLYKWFVDGISGQAGVSAAVLMEKAHQLAEQNGMAESEYMKIYINWINRLKKDAEYPRFVYME